MPSCDSQRMVECAAAVPAAQTQGTHAPAATSAPAASGPAPTQGFEPVGEESTRTEPLP